jgi:hypothetical protein
MILSTVLLGLRIAALLTTSLLVVSGCNAFDPRSGALACAAQSDCTAPRTCEMGFCVAATSSSDADLTEPDARTCGLAETISFTDDFAGSAFDDRWIVTTTGNAAAEVMNGIAELSLPKSPPFYTSAIQTTAPGFDMTGRRIFVEVVQVLARDGLTRFRVFLDPTHVANFEQRNGQLTVSYDDSAGLTEVASVTYDVAAHRWWQFRDTGTTLEFEVSADGLDFSSLGSAPTPSFVNDVRIQVYAATLTNEGSPTASQLDRLNIAPACQ